MNTIILTRHTEKDSGFDPNLTLKGKTQAKEIAGFLVGKKYEFDHVFSSVYKRSIEAAEIINERFKKPTSISTNFNEYYVRPEDGEGIEMPDTAMSRAMSKIYSVSDVFKSILIVAHSSINSDIARSILNLSHDESKDLFLNYGETLILRYSFELGDKKWEIVDRFKPVQ